MCYNFVTGLCSCSKYLIYHNKRVHIQKFFRKGEGGLVQDLYFNWWLILLCHYNQLKISRGGGRRRGGGPASSLRSVKIRIWSGNDPYWLRTTDTTDHQALRNHFNIHVYKIIWHRREWTSWHIGIPWPTDSACTYFFCSFMVKLFFCSSCKL